MKVASRWRIRLRSDLPVSEFPPEIVHLPMPELPAAARHIVDSSDIKFEFGRIGINLDTYFNVEALQRVLTVLEVR